MKYTMLILSMLVVAVLMFGHANADTNMVVAITSSIEEIDALLHDSTLQLQEPTRQIIGEARKKLLDMRADCGEMESSPVLLQSSMDQQFDAVVRFRQSKAAAVFLSSTERQQLDEIVVWLRNVRSSGGDGDLSTPSFIFEQEPTSVTSAGWRSAAPRSIRRGDIVFRTESGFLSWHFRDASRREKRFTHVAVVVRGAPNPVIAGVLVPKTSACGCVMKISWARYLCDSPDCAVYRFNGDATVADRIAQGVEARLGVPFDPAFDLETKDALYCAELVRDVVNEAVGNKVIGTTKRGNFEYVAIDDCYRNGFTKIFDVKEWKGDDVPTNTVAAKSRVPLPPVSPAPVVSKPNKPAAHLSTNSVISIRFVPGK